MTFYNIADVLKDINIFEYKELVNHNPSNNNDRFQVVAKNSKFTNFQGPIENLINISLVPYATSFLTITHEVAFGVWKHHFRRHEDLMHLCEIQFKLPCMSCLYSM